MKISDLIKKLEHIQHNRGDVEVYVDRGNRSTPDLFVCLHAINNSKHVTVRIVGVHDGN